MLSYGPCLKIFQKYRPTLTSYNDTLYDHETFVRLPLHRQELEANVQALDYIDCERKEHLLNIWNLEKNIKRNICSGDVFTCLHTSPMDSGSSLRATFNLLRALTAKPLFRKYSACFRYNEYGIVSSSSHASKPDFLISPLRSPDPPSASSTTEIPLCLSIYWISSSDLQFSLFLQKV